MRRVNLLQVCGLGSLLNELTNYHFVLPSSAVKGIGITERELSVGSSILGHSVKRHVDSVFGLLFIELHDDVGRHGKIAINPSTNAGCRMCAGNHSTVSPNWDYSVGIGRGVRRFGCRKEVKISVQLSQSAMSDAD